MEKLTKHDSVITSCNIVCKAMELGSVDIGDGGQPALKLEAALIYL